jgi:hypothetical protein
MVGRKKLAQLVVGLPSKDKLQSMLYSRPSICFKMFDNSAKKIVASKLCLKLLESF